MASLMLRKHVSERTSSGLNSVRLLGLVRASAFSTLPGLSSPYTGSFTFVVSLPASVAGLLAWSADAGTPSFVREPNATNCWSTGVSAVTTSA